MRQVELTDDQFERLVKDHKAIEIVGKVFGDAMIKACEELAEKDERFWESVCRLAGEDVRRADVKVDWVNRCVIVESKTDKRS